MLSVNGVFLLPPFGRAGVGFSPKESQALFEYHGMGQLHDCEVEQGGQHDAGHQQEDGGVEWQSGEMGGHHHCGGDAGEGQGVLEQGEEAVAGEPVYEPPPYRHPHDLEQRVGDDHRAHAIGVEPQHQGYL